MRWSPNTGQERRCPACINKGHACFHEIHAQSCGYQILANKHVAQRVEIKEILVSCKSSANPVVTKYLLVKTLPSLYK